MSTTRKKIPPDVQTSILIRSRRRCCLCFFWDNDLTQVEGQIAHIDHDASNNAQDNLVFLCLKHHNQYDSKQLQGKNVSAGEVRHARGRLYDRMGNSTESLFNVTLELDRDFDSFGESEQRELLNVIKEILERRGDIAVKSKRQGSVLLTLELRGDETERLIAAIRDGQLTRQKVVGASIDFDTTRVASVTFVESYEGGITSNTFSKQHILDIVCHPDKEQGLSRGRTVPIQNAGCILAAKSFGKTTSRDAYTALVLLAHGRAEREIVAGFRVYSAEVPHLTDWSPIDILRAFVDVYGFESEFPGIARGRLFQALSVPFPRKISDYSRLEIYLDSIRKYVSGEEGPAEHPTVYAVDPFNSRAFIELAFSVSLRPYGVCLRRHGVRVPRRFLKTSPNDKS